MTTESPSEFVVDLDGIGQFIFAKRTMRLEVKASVEFRRLTEGVALDEFTMHFLKAIADLKALTLQAPAGLGATELDELDPFDDSVYARVLRIWSALRDKEETFRRPRAPMPQTGEGA